MIRIDRLTLNSVSVLFEDYRRSYENSPSGRLQANNEVPEPYKAAIFAVWGDTPTVDESA